jgi:hypothetical protein
MTCSGLSLPEPLNEPSTCLQTVMCIDSKIPFMIGIVNIQD